MPRMHRSYLVAIASLSMACASGEDPEFAGPSGTRDTGAVTVDSSTQADSTAATDSSTTATDTGTSSADTSTPTDTGSAPVDTGTIDMDTGVADTGTTVMDTGTTMPVCAKSGEFGGSCKTNLDCAMITGCGYVCCAYDPTGTFAIGCGRNAFAGICAP